MASSFVLLLLGLGLLMVLFSKMNALSPPRPLLKGRDGPGGAAQPAGP